MTTPRFNGIVWSDLKATMDAGKPLPADMGFQPPQPISPPTEPPAGPMCRPPDMDLGEDPPPPLPARSYGPVVARRGWLLRAIERIFG